jgi:hypothetical protein
MMLMDGARMVRLLSADGWCDSILTHILVGTGFLSMVTRPLLGEQLRKRAEMDDA